MFQIVLVELFFTMPLNLGDTFPNFTVETTEGTIKFHDFLGDRYGHCGAGGNEIAIKTVSRGVTRPLQG